MFPNVVILSLSVMLAIMWAWSLCAPLARRDILQLAVVSSVCVVSFIRISADANTAIALLALTAYFSLLVFLLVTELRRLRATVYPKDERCY